jgi:hypothetical protein
MIRAATGMDFTWPPADGQGVPEVALEIAAWRTRQAAAGLPWNKDLKPADLQALHRLGIVSQDFLDKALDYLSQSKGPDSDGPTSLGSLATASTSPASVRSPSAARRAAFYL